MKKQLGKITKATFGLGGYQDAMIGIHFTIEGDGWGTSIDKSSWDKNLIKWSERCKWTEEDRDKEYSDLVRYISDIIKAAKCQTVDQLVGKPIEAEFDGMTFKSFRILTEVL